MSLSSTTIEVKWDSPLYESRNGIIREYICWITATQPWVNISETRTLNSTKIIFTELIPHTTYNIRVQAVTILPGPYSASIPTTTLQAGNYY